MYGIDRAGKAFRSAERAENLAGEVHFVDATHAPDEHHLIGAAGETQSPRRSRQVPHCFEIPFRIEHLDTTIGAVGDLNHILDVYHDAVGRVEFARPVAAFAQDSTKFPTLSNLAMRELKAESHNVAAGRPSAAGFKRS